MNIDDKVSEDGSDMWCMRWMRGVENCGSGLELGDMLHCLRAPLGHAACLRLARVINRLRPANV